MSPALRFTRFMAHPTGRLLRIVAGGALIAGGFALGGTGGIVLAIVGLVPLAAGMFNFCVIAPLLGTPFKGRDALSAKTAVVGSLT